MTTSSQIRYIYGPVHSWRGGTSLGVDPIGEISTCSFNCSYCQLGQIQNITTEIKDYVAVDDVLRDLEYFYEQETFVLPWDSEQGALDVITFAGSGEPTLAANLDEMILGIRNFQISKLRSKYSDLSAGEIESQLVPISILTNATLFNDERVCRRVALADRISLKLDAGTDLSLKSINQAESSISLEGILTGIEKLKTYTNADLQLQVMFMPKFVEGVELDDAQWQESYPEACKHFGALLEAIKRTGVMKIQINTPTRAKPRGKEYWIETRGNHYSTGEQPSVEMEMLELPVISEGQAFAIEARLRAALGDKAEIINVYKR